MEQNNNDQSLTDTVRDMQDTMQDMQQMLQTMQAMMAQMEVQNRAPPIRREQQRRDVGLPRYVDQPPFLKNLETPPIQREQQRRDVGLPSSGKCQIIHWRQGHNEECHPPHVDDKYHGQTNISDPKGEPVEQPNVSDSSLEFEEQPRAKAVETHLKRPSSESNCSTNIITEDKPEDKPAVDASETESTSDSFDSSTPSSSTFSGITETSDDGSTTTGENRKNSEAKPDDGISDSSDQNSPRGVLEIPVSSADSDGSGSGSSSSETSLVDRSIATDGSVLESHSLQWKNLIGGLILRKKRSIMRLSTFPPATGGLGLQRTQSEKDKVESGEITTEIGRGRPSWRSFDYQELAAATDNFSPDKLIGKGGYAEFYRGCLADGQIVAVKRLTKKDNEERIGDFLSELGIIAHVNHPNAAQLLGFSVEGGLHLVLRFSPHGSLASVLHGLKEGLEWKVRFKIALGIAEGLLYLHEGCQRRIIHRDIKASNILLTEDFQPQISDFGLAKWLPDKWTHHIVFPIEGTFGYLAPEYFMHGVVNEKIDVFAFGVLLLELTTGRRAVDSSRQSLVIWAKPLLDANNVKELADPSPGDAYDPEEMRRSLLAASMCIHHLSTSRPDMNWVVRLLKGEEGSAELMGRELRPKLARPPLFDASDSEMRGNKSFSFRLISNQDEVYYTYEILDSSIISPLVLSKQGEVERFVWSNLSNYWNRYWYAPKDPCDSYASCGPNGVCNVSDPFFCQCLRGFHSKSTMDWNLNIYSGGCVRRTGLDFQSDGFSELQNVKLPDISNATADRNKSLDECREWCLKNFSCVAFAISGGNGCVSWTGNLIDIRVFAEGGENLFVRLAASELDTIKGDSSKKKHVIVIVIPLLLGFLLLVFIGLFILKRKSKPGITSDSYFEERKAEDLELPLFDMSMIENATNDFSSNNKLGEGGFGPVYKGQLRDGQEIAAKRLSKDSSQGLDEFKLEVKLFRGRGE